MRFYRVPLYTEGGISNGFLWGTNRREVERAARRTIEPGDGEEDLPGPVQTVEIKPTRRGIYRALCFYASHPDNG